MRIAFIAPHSQVYQKDRELQNRISGVEEIETVPNLALLSLAAFLPPREEGIFIDEDYLTLKGLPFDYLKADYDLVCLTAMNHQAPRAYELASHFKQRGIKTLMGGFHASALPREALKFVDSVAVGEGEDIFPHMLQDFKRGKLQPLYRSSGKVDLTKLPPPRLELVKELCWYSKVGLFATRGCGHQCSFCCLWQVYGPGYRKKKIEQVVSEIKLAKSLYPGALISFADENMLADPEFGKALARALIPLKIEWECYCDTGVAAEGELLKLLAKSGCRELIIGFESLNPASLGEAGKWKKEQQANYRQVISRIQQAGIGVLACFVVGFDHDNRETFPELLSFLKATRPLELDIATLTPMPGTPLYRKLKREGRILSADWSRYSWYRVNFKPKNLSPQEIMDGIKWVFQEFNKLKAGAVPD